MRRSTARTRGRSGAIADQEIAKQAPGLNVASAATSWAEPRRRTFQRFCSGRLDQGDAVVDTTGLAHEFTNVPGFNCFQPGNLNSSVQIERLAQGQYFVRFVGNSGRTHRGPRSSPTWPAMGSSPTTSRTRPPCPGRTCSWSSCATAPGTRSTTGRSRYSPSRGSGRPDPLPARLPLGRRRRRPWASHRRRKCRPNADARGRRADPLSARLDRCP